MSKLIKKNKLALMSVIIAAASVTAAPVHADAGGGRGSVMVVGGDWVIMAGSSLKATLEGWCRAAGWTLIWDSPVDYRVRASASFRGPFDQSAARLIDSISIGNPELLATFHRENRVVHIENQPLTSN